MSWVITGICIVTIIVLLILLRSKVKVDNTEREVYEANISVLKNQEYHLRQLLEYEQEQLTYAQKDYEQKQRNYNKLIAQQANEINTFYEDMKARRMEQLENEIQAHKDASIQNLEQTLGQLTDNYESQARIAEQAAETIIEECQARAAKIEDEVQAQEARLNSLLAPLKQYELDKQAKLFYTIQIPEEYRSDIDYLLITVAPQVRHPDIVSKLVWTEYVKPYMDDMLKRVGIEDKPGIYKITNIDSGKSYIGKSTNVKKRLQDHLKSTVGIQSIADQAIHHAILKDGIWNWSFELISYADKEQLNELEKYYIGFFHSQEFGYNKTAGG